MKKNTLFAITLLLAMSCEQNDQESCLQGTILKYNCCVGATSISLRSYVPYSKTIKENGQTYHNVVIVAGHVEGTESGDNIFLHVRKYKSQDSNLLDGMCLCAIAEGDYPSYVITAFSPSGCP